jgi:hypothetical protein
MKVGGGLCRAHASGHGEVVQVCFVQLASVTKRNSITVQLQSIHISVHGSLMFTIMHLQFTKLQQQLSEQSAALAGARAEVQRMEGLVQVGGEPSELYYSHN